MKKLIVCLLMAVGCIAFLPANVAADSSAPCAMHLPQNQITEDLALQILKFAASELSICEATLISKYENGQVEIVERVENDVRSYRVLNGGGLLIEILEGQI